LVDSLQKPPEGGTTNKRDPRFASKKSFRRIFDFAILRDQTCHASLRYFLQVSDEDRVNLRLRNAASKPIWTVYGEKPARPSASRLERMTIVIFGKIECQFLPKFAWKTGDLRFLVSREDTWLAHEMRSSSSSVFNFSFYDKFSLQGDSKMLVLSRKLGERLVIGDDIVLIVNKIAGNRVTLAIEAPNHVRVVRGELSPLEQSGGPKSHSMAPFDSAGGEATAVNLSASDLGITFC
jgi:carbon storage regulator